ncbi:MAG TPA: TetR/AcrR family transcriptional regulator [Arachnia sp.]|nr:TetR/AcrR family transcriptional regulator [Arachnia sp.]
MHTDGLPDPKRRILEAAKEVFGANGYRGGSLNDIAKRSGYTRAGLLHHYPSKEAILLALLDLRDERLNVLRDPGSDDRGIAEVLEELPASIGLILEDRVLIQLAHALTAEAAHPDHPARAWAARRHQLLREMTTAAIRRSIDRGELPETTNPGALSAVILGAVEGAEAQWLVNPAVDPVACAETVVTLVHALVDTHRA